MSAEGGGEIRGQDQGGCSMEKSPAGVSERRGKGRAEREGRLTYEGENVG